MPILNKEFDFFTSFCLLLITTNMPNLKFEHEDTHFGIKIFGSLF